MDERLFNVNRYGVLRIPGLMWVALALLARHWLWILFTLASARRGGESFALLSEGIPWWPLAIQLPVVLLMLAGGHRVPSAGSISRNLWHRGYIIVLMTALMNLCWTVWCLKSSADWHPRPEMAMVCFSVLDLAIAWGLWSSQYLRQVFAEFPALVESASK